MLTAVLFTLICTCVFKKKCTNTINKMKKYMLVIHFNTFHYNTVSFCPL